MKSGLAVTSLNGVINAAMDKRVGHHERPGAAACGNCGHVQCDRAEIPEHLK